MELEHTVCFKAYLCVPSGQSAYKTAKMAFVISIMTSNSGQSERHVTNSLKHVYNKSDPLCSLYIELDEVSPLEECSFSFSLFV